MNPSQDRGPFGILRRPLKTRLESQKQVLESYSETLKRFEDLEHSLKNLPEIEVMGAQYFPVLLSYPICIAKELCKYASKSELRFLVDNFHIAEEIRTLEKTLQNLKEDINLARKRQE